MNVYLFKVSVFFGKVNSNLGGGGGGEYKFCTYITWETNQTTSDLAMFTKENTPRWTEFHQHVNSLHAG